MSFMYVYTILNNLYLRTVRLQLRKYFDPFFDNQIFFFAFLRKIQLDDPPKTHLKNVESVVSFVEKQPEHIEKKWRKFLIITIYLSFHLIVLFFFSF